MSSSRHHCFSLLFFLLFHKISCATDTITASLSVKDGEGETAIVSSNGAFQLGFFSPGKSGNLYLGIWYNNISVTTVVWVANRETPLNTTSGILKIIKPGILVLLNEANSTIWSTNTSRTVQNPIAQLLDSGNLVIKDAGDGNEEKNFVWQSFDYPTDTYLPGMKLGWNFVTGHETYLTSWKNREDPATGDYMYYMNRNGFPQNFLNKGSAVVYRSGPWNGFQFSGSPNSRKSPFYEIGFVFNQTGAYFTNQLLQPVLTRATLRGNGFLERTTWIDRTQSWGIYLSIPTDSCDTYKLCGAYGICNIQSSPMCGCLDKFVPKNQEDWLQADWSSGCVRRTPLSCNEGEGFLKYSAIKLPDTQNAWFNQTMTLEECKALCAKNCSCMAYSNIEIRNGGTGCFMWFDDLLDIRLVPKEGQDIYIRVAASEIASQAGSSDSSGKKRKIIIITVLPSAGAFMLTLILVACYRRKKCSEGKHKVRRGHNMRDYNEEDNSDEFELPVFDLTTLNKATNNFLMEYKLGEGGFGPVYKGVLDNGQEIAVKRLSGTSTQGQDEFKNEVLCIAKLQHRNLIRMLGCCIEGEEKTLIYEFMPNGSLDAFIFDEAQSRLLDWPKRFQIINGIARGLMYLHQDSRLRIIHRDLKASNILLDTNLEPKISDFGIARFMGGNEIEAKTHRVVGTYGYISPEYALRGLYSVKSDVFSFGVLVLEIISGKRNTKFTSPDDDINLLGYAWKLYREGRSMELLEPHLSDTHYSLSISEVCRSIHVALLCVQQRPEDRPSMSSVILMLNNEGVLPPAKQPGFFTEGDSTSCSSRNELRSTNEITITSLEPR
ncbi:G-type lectin S-receptor-like serine/threonine-protein kinase At4g27290 isoform X2 [Ipomoea triloba]|uniref:G-type lectin S-receptor-like serine/threonine-protein kinase At4g27290 isoform X2 n=1 Tax=Ipomoea triloba TaxID=35885 RepID=UPI00125E7C1C|nr:G-type lectin S-receptor-like serine/threonine-protein kinase At4g27290 isoform X2 [Ipomoea triloba]